MLAHSINGMVLTPQQQAVVLHCETYYPTEQQPCPTTTTSKCLTSPAVIAAHYEGSTISTAMQPGRTALAGNITHLWFARGCKRCAALGMNDLPVDDETHLLFSCPATAVVRRERRFAQLPFTSLQDLMYCCDVYGVALFVHKCIKIADAAAVAAARQQPK
jgi:hypothetical protein